MWEEGAPRGPQLCEVLDPQRKRKRAGVPSRRRHSKTCVKAAPDCGRAGVGLPLRREATGGGGRRDSGAALWRARVWWRVEHGKAALTWLAGVTVQERRRAAPRREGRSLAVYTWSPLGLECQGEVAR